VIHIQLASDKYGSWRLQLQSQFLALYQVVERVMGVPVPFTVNSDVLRVVDLMVMMQHAAVLFALMGDLIEITI
jgi:hypothetical protein